MSPEAVAVTNRRSCRQGHGCSSSCSCRQGHGCSKRLPLQAGLFTPPAEAVTLHPPSLHWRCVLYTVAVMGAAPT